MNSLKIIVLLLLFISNLSYAENPSYKIFEGKPDKVLTTSDYVKGSSFLVAEYIAVPLFMKHIWWEDGWEMRNPFNDKVEMEPYHVDESWHAAMNYFMQDVHYTVLRSYFGIKSPYPSLGLTWFSWTMIEVLDAMEKSDQWGFSVNDEIGNMFGLATWLAHHYYPGFKFYIRGGIRDWATMAEYTQDAHTFFTDSDAYYSAYGKDKYAMSKVEYIYKWYGEFYSGVAVSKDAIDSDVFGYTMGWDAISYGNNKTKGWWNYPGRLFSSSFALSLSFTIWTEKPTFTFF